MTIQVSATTETDGDSAMVTLVAFLLANGWTAMASGDGGSGYSSSDGSQWTTPASGMWIRLRSTAVSTREWVFQRKAAATTWTIVRAPTFGTVGNATTVPTDSTSQTLFSNAQVFAATVGRWRIGLNNVTGSWTAFSFASGGGNVVAVLFDEALLTGTYPTTPVADADPHVFGGYYNATGLTALGQFVPTASSTLLAYKRLRHGLSSASNVRVTYLGLWHAATGGYCAPAADTSNYQLGGDPYNTDEVPLLIPVGAPGANGVTKGWAGYLTDHRWCTVGARANGQTLAASGSYWIYCAGCWVAWDATNPAV